MRAKESVRKNEESKENGEVSRIIGAKVTKYGALSIWISIFSILKCLSSFLISKSK